MKNPHAAGLDANLSAIRYSIAFYRGDRTGMAQEFAAATGKPGIEDLVLELDADTADVALLPKFEQISDQRARKTGSVNGRVDSTFGWHPSAGL